MSATIYVVFIGDDSDVTIEVDVNPLTPEWFNRDNLVQLFEESLDEVSFTHRKVVDEYGR